MKKKVLLSSKDCIRLIAECVAGRRVRNEHGDRRLNESANYTDAKRYIAESLSTDWRSSLLHHKGIQEKVESKKSYSDACKTLYVEEKGK